jgi:hypothetical protein
MPEDSHLQKLILSETEGPTFKVAPNSYSLWSADICIQFIRATINGVQEVRVFFYMCVLSAGGVREGGEHCAVSGSDNARSTAGRQKSVVLVECHETSLR